MFTTCILVRFGDLDAAGIAYYPNLVNFLHESFEDFFVGHVGRPYPEVYAEGLGFPTVKLEVDFMAPVRYGDHVDMRLTVEKVGLERALYVWAHESPWSYGLAAMLFALAAGWAASAAFRRE